MVLKIKTFNQSCVCCGSSESLNIKKTRDYHLGRQSQLYYYDQCLGCGHIYLRNVPEIKEIGKIYPLGQASPKLAKVSEVDVLKKLISSPTSILDIGCGTGQRLELCRTVFPQADLNGVEIDVDAGETAIDKGFKVQIGSVDYLELPENCYDIIFLKDTIENVYDPRQVIKKSAKALKTGGVLVIRSANPQSWARKVFGRYWAGYNAPRHFNIFSSFCLQGLARESGLHLEEEINRLSPRQWFKSLQNLINYRQASPFLTTLIKTLSPLLLMGFLLIEMLQQFILGRTSSLELLFLKKD